MSTSSLVSVATTVFVTVAAAASAQPPPVTKGDMVTSTATIQAIDSTARTVTLRDEKGQEDTYTLGPEVKRFDEFKVGDKVTMTYYESIVLQVREPGQKGPTEEPAGATMTRSKGATPGATAALQDRMTVTVNAIDPSVPSVTVTTPDGRTVTRKVEDKKNIEGLEVGDQIDITYTLALVAHIEHVK
jgi:Cu/Ag efflux protein CusF